jgi:hypothetical protein
LLPKSMRLARISQCSKHKYLLGIGTIRSANVWPPFRESVRSLRLSQRSGVCGLARSSAQAKLHRRQGPTRRDQQARRQLFASHISQWRSRSVVLVEDSKSRPLVGVAAWPKAPARRSRCAGEQNGAHCLGHHEPRGGLPNRRSGGLISQATAPQACESRKRVMAKSVVPTN